MRATDGVREKIMRARSTVLVQIGSVAALLVLLASATQAGSEPLVHFAIPAGDAARALDEFGAQAAASVAATPDELRGLSTTAVYGDLRPSEALARLLAGTGLEARRDAGGVLRIARSTLALHLGPPAATDLLAATFPAPASAVPGEPVESIVVTGSYIRRTDTETPSVLQTITAEEIEKSGRTTISDVIRSSSADNSGTLTQNFSGAMAGGASGVSLRGLTLDATLVLVDGHRMAPYALADDGQRPFVDLSSLPLGIIERVEILKDGASSIYGSDAIAGVVNIILRKDFKGFETAVDLGSSWKGDGLAQRVSATYGFGDLQSDGRNVYFNLEYRHQSSIAQNSRGGWLANLDLRSVNGPDLRGGLIQQAPPFNSTFTVPGQVAPQLTVINNLTAANPDNFASYYLLPGCKPGPDYTGGCLWDTNAYRKIQPRTAGLNFTGHWVEALGNGWRNQLVVSLFNSQSEQYRQSDSYSDGPTTVPYTWAGSNGIVVDQTDPTTTRIVLPPNSLDNPFNPKSPYFAGARAYYNGQPGAPPNLFNSYIGQPALFSGVLTDFGPQISHYNTDVIRIVDDLSGTLAGWETDLGVGFIRSATRVRYEHYIRASLLDAALADGSYRVGQNAYLNPPSLYSTIAPETQDTATSTLAYLSANASRSLFPLPGGDLALAFGVDARTWALDNPGEPYARQGDIIMDGTFYAKGTQNVGAAFVELSAPVLRNLEFDASARFDHYNLSGSALTPKIGFKWTLIPALALRGTYAGGFRAPGPAENGNAASASATTGQIDPLRCPFTGKPSDCGLAAVAVLSPGNAGLKPEKSKSYTLGIIVEPVKHVNLTFDYFDIKRNDEITSAPLTLDTAVRGAPQGNLPGPIVYYPTPYVNASFSKTTGFDVDLKLTLPLGDLGKLSADFSETHLFHSHQVVGGADYEYAGTVGPTVVGGAVGTPRDRGMFTLDWTRGAASLGAIVNYRGVMRGIDESLNGDACIQPIPSATDCHVASFTWLDVYGQLQISEHLQGTLTVLNVTNRLPPLNAITYGGSNYNPSLDQAGAVGRFFELAIKYRF
jgi:iron complex outermembrane receptor protein